MTGCPCSDGGTANGPCAATCSPWPSTSANPPVGGSPNSSGFGSWPSPDASSAPAAEDGYDFPGTGPGTSSSTPAGTHSAPPEAPSEPLHDSRAGLLSGKQTSQ